MQSSFIVLSVDRQYLIICNINDIHNLCSNVFCLARFDIDSGCNLSCKCYTSILILMDGFKILFETEITYLGFVVDASFSWILRLITLCSKFRSRLFPMIRYTQFQHFITMRFIYTSLIE